MSTEDANPTSRLTSGEALTEEILKYLDRDLSPDEERALVSAIRARKEHQRLFLRLARLHAGIPGVLAAMDGEESSGATRKRWRFGDRARSERRRWPKLATLGLVLVGTAGAMAAVTMGLRWARSRSVSPPTISQGSPRAVGNTKGVNVPAIVPVDPAMAVQPPAATTQGPSAPAGTPAPPTVLALSLDFEAQDPKVMITQGHMTASPGERRGQSVVGTVDLWWPSQYTVRIERHDAPLISYLDTIVVSFDYWLEPGARKLSVITWNRDKQQNYGITFQDVVNGTWARAVIRLEDLRGYLDLRVPQEQGDRISQLLIIGGRTSGERMFIDNLRVEDVPAELLPPESSVHAPSP
jgi:hypothetical protein